MRAFVSDKKMDVQTEQQAFIKFFVHLKKPIPYILVQLIEIYKDEALKPSTVKNGTNCTRMTSQNWWKWYEKMLAVDHAHHWLRQIWILGL